VQPDRSDGFAGWRVFRPLAAANLLMLGAAIGLRVWRLDNVPGMNGDEAWYGVLARTIADGRAATWLTPTGNPVNPFYVGPLVLVHLLAEPSVVVLRSVAAASGILALGLNYWLCRKVFGQPAAAISTLTLAVLPINIAYSRFGWDASQTLLATLPVLYFAMAAARGGPGAWRALSTSAGALVAAVLVHPTNIFLAPLVVAAGVRASSRKEIWRRFLRLPGSARVALSAAFVLLTAGLAWLGRSWVVVAAQRLADPDEILEFVNRFQRLFTGATIYQFIPGGFGSVGSRSPSLAIYDLLGLAVLSAAVALLIGRARQKPESLDSTLLSGWAASLAVFYLVAGPQALAPHWERYAIWLVGPTSLIIARSATEWLRQADGAQRRALLLVTVGWLITGSFYWNYFQAFYTTGGTSHQTFRTGPVEPKTAAIEHIVHHRADDSTQWIVTSTWWSYWPLTYLARTDHALEVVWADRAWSDPRVVTNAAAGRVWVVEFAGSDEAVAGLSALRTASASARMGDEAPLPHQVQAFTFDYAGRAVLSIVRTEPSSR
jgi:hypothetical protein